MEKVKSDLTNETLSRTEKKKTSDIVTCIYKGIKKREVTDNFECVPVCVHVI